MDRPMNTDDRTKIAEDALCRYGFCLIGGEWIAPDDMEPVVEFEPVDEQHIDFLWFLLESRPKDACISHTKMPTMKEHADFVRSKPYEVWYIIKDRSRSDGDLVGACYITRNNEIGVHIHHNFQAQGYGRRAVKKLMAMHGPRKWLANIAPLNDRSQMMFSRLGFRQLQQVWVKDA